MSDDETEAPDHVDLLPGYRIDAATGAWLTLPWPDDLDQLPPSLAPQIFAWTLGQRTPAIAGTGEGPRLLHHLTGDAWQFTLSQRMFLHLWYAVRPDGRWLYRSGVKRGAKGTGKDPFLGALIHVEARGPVVFDGFDKQGRPIGRPHRMGLVQIGANSEGQAADVLRVSNGMISAAYAAECGADTGILRTNLGEAKVEVLTTSEASQEGDPATAIFLNESHHMTGTNQGQALAGVARRNVGKSPGGLARILEATNAHLPGEGSVAEDSFEAWQAQVAGSTRRQDILYDSREAAPHLRLHIEEELEEGIAQAYADSPWTDRERIRDEAQDPRVPLADSVRYYFNSLPTNELAWVDPRKFDARQVADLVVGDGEPIALFLDCSKSTDSTTLCASRISDGHVMGLGGWQRPHGDRGTGWLAPREEVDAVVQETFARYRVRWFGVDPSPARDDDDEAVYWASLIDEWHRRYARKVALWATPGKQAGNAVMFDMRLSARGGAERNRLFTEQAERTVAEIEDEQTLTWDGTTMLRLHVHNARRRPNQWGVGIGKASRSSTKLVDYAVSMVGARLGRRLVLNHEGVVARKKPRTGIVQGIR